MSTWTIISWVLVAILTAINIVVFLQLKKASEQMMKMAFPNAKNMNDAVAQMQNMMKGMGGGGGMGAMGAKGGKHGMPRMPQLGGKPGAGGNMDAQLKAAMDMLSQMKKTGGKR